MTIFLIFFAFFLFALLVNYKKEWGIYLTVLLLPAYQIRFEILSIPATFLEGLVLILLLFAAADLLKSHGLKGFVKAELASQKIRTALIFLFLLAATISVFVAPDYKRAAGLWKAFFVEPVIFFFLAVWIVNTAKKLENLFKTFAWLLLYLGGFGVYQFLSLANLPFSWWAVDVASRRITSLLNHPNALALLIGPLLAMLIIHMLTNKTALRSKLFQSAAVLGAAALFLSFSRAGWLAIIISAVVFGFFTRYKKSVIASALAVVLLTLTVPFAREKIISLLQGRDLAQENRIVLWTAAADIIKKNPLTGTGLQGFREAYKNYPLGPDRVVQNYPHNFFLNFWVETGLLGLISMIGLLALFYKQLWAVSKQNKGSALAVAAGMTVILLHGMADVPYFKNDLAILFWLILALPFLQIKDRAGESAVPGTKYFDDVNKSPV